MNCICYLAHEVEHRCRYHQDRGGIRADEWVEAGQCRYCAAEEVEKLEVQLELAKERWKAAKNPRPW